MKDCNAQPLYGMYFADIYTCSCVYIYTNTYKKILKKNLTQGRREIILKLKIYGDAYNKKDTRGITRS